MDNMNIFYFRAFSGHLETVTVDNKDTQPEGVIYPCLELNWLCNRLVKVVKRCF